MRQRIQTVIFDWAGTVIDYGCFAPMHAFLHTFEQAGVPVTMREARGPMGLLKRDHIQEMLRMELIRREWTRAYGSDPGERDIDRLYETFEKTLMDSLSRFTDPIPGALDVVAQLRGAGVKIGSTTGYTKKMMEVVAQGADQKGYAPDYLICSDEVKAGRPYPYMIFRNLYELESFPPCTVVKVGDTVSDVQEALHAGVWSVAVIKGGSELGMTEDEVRQAPLEALRERMEEARSRLEAAGAHIVIDSIDGLPDAIGYIERRLSSNRVGGTYDEPVL